MPLRAVQRQDGFDLPQNFAERIGVTFAVEFRASLDPVEGAHLVGKYSPGDLCAARGRNLLYAALHLIGDGAGKTEACGNVIVTRRENESRPFSGLLRPRLWREIDDDEVASIRLIGLSHQTSSPFGFPQSTSSCFALSCARRSANLKRLRVGRMTRASSSISKLTVTPSPSRALSARWRGSLTAKLLPHFATVPCIIHLCYTASLPIKAVYKQRVYAPVPEPQIKIRQSASDSLPAPRYVRSRSFLSGVDMAATSDEWAAKAKGMLKAEMARAGVKHGDLAAKLTEMGLPETEGSVQVKINRGAFPAWFLLAALKAVGCSVLRLEES